VVPHLQQTIQVLLRKGEEIRIYIFAACVKVVFLVLSLPSTSNHNAHYGKDTCGTTAFCISFSILTVASLSFLLF
jgi:hypothetical protein